jgi:hypothetical protein
MGHAEHDRVEHPVGDGEPNVDAVAGLAVRPVPRSRVVDGLGVHSQPPTEREQPTRLDERDRAVAGRSDIEQQVATVRHDLDEHPHEVVG